MSMMDVDSPEQGDEVSMAGLLRTLAHRGLPPPLSPASLPLHSPADLKLFLDWTIAQVAQHLLTQTPAQFNLEDQLHVVVQQQVESIYAAPDGPALAQALLLLLKAFLAPPSPISGIPSHPSKTKDEATNKILAILQARHRSLRTASDPDRRPCPSPGVPCAEVGPVSGDRTDYVHSRSLSSPNNPSAAPCGPKQTQRGELCPGLPLRVLRRSDRTRGMHLDRTVDAQFGLIADLLTHDKMFSVCFGCLLSKLTAPGVERLLGRHPTAKLALTSRGAHLGARARILPPNHIVSLLLLSDQLKTHFESLDGAVAQSLAQLSAAVFTQLGESVHEHIRTGESSLARGLDEIVRAVLGSPALQRSIPADNFTQLLQWNSIVHHWDRRHGVEVTEDKSAASVSIRKIFPTYDLSWRNLESIALEFPRWTKADQLVCLKNVFFHLQSADIQRHLPLEWLREVIVSPRSGDEGIVFADLILQRVISHSSPQKLHNFIVRALDDLAALIYETIGASTVTLSVSPALLVGFRKIAILRALISSAVHRSSAQFATVATFCVQQLCVPQPSPTSDPRSSLALGSKQLPPKEVIRNEIDHQFTSILLNLLQPAPAWKLNSDNMNSLAEAFLSSMPHLAIPTYEQYGEVLPRKPIFERDVAIEQLLQRQPGMVNILELLAEDPPVLCRCMEIIKSILAILIGNWNSDAAMFSTTPVPSPRRQMWLPLTSRMLRLFLKAQLIPNIFINISSTLPHILSSDIVQQLTTLWVLLKDHPPTAAAYGTRLPSSDPHVPPAFHRKWPDEVQWPMYIEPYKLVLRKHIDKLAPFLLHVLQQDKSSTATQPGPN